MESFQVVMQMLLLPMLFLSGALFPLNGLPGWLTVVTRLNPLTYAVAPFRDVVFSAQNMPAAARPRFPTSVTLFGYSLPHRGRLRPGLLRAGIPGASPAPSEPPVQGPDV